jgi:Tfp pilus assembly protein PilO
MILPTSLKIACAVFIIILMGTAFWLADWQKKDAELRQLTLLEKARRPELERSRALVRELPAERSKKASLEGGLRTIMQEELAAESEAAFVPSYISDMERLIEYKRRQMEDPDFTISSLTPGGLAESGQERSNGGKQKQGSLRDYPARTFQMQLAGRYHTLIDFLRDLGALRLKRLVTISKLTLSPQGESGIGRSPILAIQMPITAYLRQAEPGR